MKQNNRLTRRIGAAAALAAVTTCGSLVMAPAAFADSTVASATTHSATPSAVAVPETGVQCTATLILFGYPVTTQRGLICYLTASLSNLAPEAAKLAACVAAMKATGVGLVAAGAACSDALSEA
jgi:hypothetical protein